MPLPRDPSPCTARPARFRNAERREERIAWAGSDAYDAGVSWRPSWERAALGIALFVVIVPRVLLWGHVPAVVDGDEMGFFATGISQFAHPGPLWSFGPNSLPAAHFWLMGLADAALGRDIWSARLVTALFGAVQALAIVGASFRLAGGSGALTAAAVLCLPLELHFERLNMCNVWTTATWSCAFALTVLAPWQIWSSCLAGAVLAAGWYGYQSSRLLPFIIALPLLMLFVQASWHRRLVIGLGVLSFLLTLAPLLYGFWLTPQVFAGRATQTSWTTAGFDPVIATAHLQATLSAIGGSAFDLTPFFPYQMPMFSMAVTLLAVVGLAMGRPWPLALCLAGWIGGVLLGNFARNILVYSCVLICAVPALAAAAALAARLIGVVAPLLAMVAVFPMTARYFRDGREVPPSMGFAMAHYHAVQSVPLDAPMLVADSFGCAHGFNQLHRRCFDVPDLAIPPAPGTYAVVTESMLSLADAIPGERERVERFGVPLVVVRPVAEANPSP